MSPDDLVTVERSWREVRRRRGTLLSSLRSSFGDGEHPELAGARARWLVDAVDELVGLLASPSRLGDRARRLATTWPLPDEAPSFAVDGCAWLLAARRASPTWTDRAERAWRHAWLLLSDELADETLSPFAASCEPSLDRHPYP